jgi:hypothetical protein
MTFSECNGGAIRLREFEQLLWSHPAFGNAGVPEWNLQHIPAFLEWHLKSTPHQRYVVGAAILEKRAIASRRSVGTDSARESGEKSDPLIPRRVRDLVAICAALESCREEHLTYPQSSGGWDGLFSHWGQSKSEWISGLVPEYLRHLPRDPRCNDAPEQQYLYRSDGHDYKLISHSPEDYAYVKLWRPGLADPVREGWAYGFWTEGAISW